MEWLDADRSEFEDELCVSKTADEDGMLEFFFSLLRTMLRLCGLHEFLRPCRRVS